MLVGSEADALVTPSNAEEFLRVIRENHETRVKYKPGRGVSRAKEIAQALKINTALVELDLACWRIGSEGGKQLSKYIKVNNTLKTLRLVRNQIGANGGDLIALALLSNASITSFTYFDNYLTSAGMHAIGRHLSQFDRLRELSLSVYDNGFGQDKFYLPITKAIKLNRGLRMLSLACTGRYDFDALIGSLKVNRTLEKMKLGYRPVDGLEALHDLRGRTTLKELKVTLPFLKYPTDGILLGEFIAAAQQLTSLRYHLAYQYIMSSKESTRSLNGTSIKKEAMPGVCKGIEASTSLVRLGMSSCGLKDESCGLIKRALLVNKSLTAVELVNYGIERKGCFHLLDALKKNRRIQYMSVVKDDDRRTELSYVRKMIEAQVKLNRSFQEEQFLRQLESDKKVSWQRCRLMIVGQGGAGKTATVRALTNKRFDEEWKSTVGISMQECKTSTKGAWAEGARGGFTSDVANRLMVEGMTKEPDDSESKPIVEDKKGSSNTPVKMIEEEVVSKEENISAEVEEEVASLKETRKEIQDEVMTMLDDSVFVETKDNMDTIRLTVFDMGGQRVFYTFHHLFLSSNAVYLIIFSLVKLQQDPNTALAFLKHWIESIKIHAPVAPLLFVGTFLDQIEQGSLPVVIKVLCDAFPGVATRDTFTAISNRSGEGVEELRDRIDGLILAQDFVFTPVSVRWMRALDLTLQSKQPWTTYKRFREHSERCGITSTAEMNEALKLFHLFGSVLYFDATETLKDLLIHDPQWLVDEISKVIRDARIHEIDTASLQQAGLEEDGEALRTMGICSRDLLEFLWEKDEAEYLTSLMESLLLISRVHRHGGDTATYLIPSMASPTKVLSESERVSDEHCRVALEYMPQGVFERIVCMCVSYSETRQRSNDEGHAPMISLHQGVVWIGANYQVVLERKDHEAKTLDLYIEGAENVMTTIPIIEAMLQKVKFEFMNGSLAWTTQINVSHTWMQYADAKEQKLAPWFDVDEAAEKKQPSSLQIDAFLSNI